jgi:hypothetical protein
MLGDRTRKDNQRPVGVWLEVCYLIIMDIEDYMHRYAHYTHDSFAKTRETTLREHNCQGILVFSIAPFPIPAAWRY